MFYDYDMQSHTIAMLRKLMVLPTSGDAATALRDRACAAVKQAIRRIAPAVYTVEMRTETFTPQTPHGMTANVANWHFNLNHQRYYDWINADPTGPRQDHRDQARTPRLDQLTPSKGWELEEAKEGWRLMWRPRVEPWIEQFRRICDQMIAAVARLNGALAQDGYFYGENPSVSIDRNTTIEALEMALQSHIGREWFYDKKEVRLVYKYN
ncbi:uncharacterized protein ACA1_067730 [Acanthamoeba castellanii str. Neff]|uniref:Uncharacterized protein n=1 Tax=Acanthamoeba castellanii (strain ATCC 30010 / Neff) TaxID=1257118 RepID=L8HCE1_ACACF|nr:uncharacterized protein ACA1_067730 [Acanthamoeba castellanii str. Neff]ELR23189.1 hypothetical protein ACA1_067730 [Acanthamoeba castellanii str. Neff]